MTGKKRLAKIEEHLTPQQAVLAYLAEMMRRFGCFLDWAESVAENPSEAPLVRVSTVVREAAQSTRKGWAKGTAARGGDGAVREAIFLVKLFLRVTEELLGKAASYSLQASLCARSLQVLLQQAMGEAAPGMPVSVQDEPESRQHQAQEADERPDFGLFCQDRAAAMRSQVCQHLGTLYLQQMVINAVRDKYFGGHAVLFPAQARRLEGLIETAEALADEYNGFVGAIRAAPSTQPGADGQPAPNGDGEGTLPIDRQAVRKRAAASVGDEVAFTIRMAQADTLIALGRNEEGWNLAVDAYRQQYPKRQ